MNAGSIRTVTLAVTVQENGIMRRSDGQMLGRILDFDEGQVNAFSKLEALEGSSVVPLAEVRRLREIERQWNAVHDAQARTVQLIREGLELDAVFPAEEMLEEAILYGCGDSLTSTGTKLRDELSGSGALKDIVYVTARRLKGE